MIWNSNVEIDKSIESTIVLKQILALIKLKTLGRQKRVTNFVAKKEIHCYSGSGIIILVIAKMLQSDATACDILCCIQSCKMQHGTA